MKNISEGPSSWRANKSERRYGKIMPDENELKKVREKAKKTGSDPDMAEIMYLKKLDQANARLREAQGEQARKSAEGNLEKEL